MKGKVENGPKPKAKKKNKKKWRAYGGNLYCKKKKKSKQEKGTKEKKFFFSKAFKFVLRDSKTSESVTRGDDYAVFFFFPRVLPPRHLIAYLIYLFTYLFIRSIYSRTMRELLFS